jgi:mono/diheme cytochrome c family protein
MSKIEIKIAPGTERVEAQNDKERSASRRSRLLALLVSITLLAGCRQDMHDQPKYKTFRPSTFFEDGKSERQLVDGTVPRRNLREDPSRSDGDSNGGRWLSINDRSAPHQVDLSKATTLPFPLTREVMDRGQERFSINCLPCHGTLGDGNGMVSQRGFRHPPSFHIERLRKAPIGHFYDAMTNGFGAMPSYSDQVAPRDRWAIAAYIRALQLSRGATIDDVPPAERNKLGGEKK